MTLPQPPERIRRVVYLGTPDLAVEPLLALHDAGYEIPLVVTRADKRRGRGGRVDPSPVKAAAIDLGLTVTSDLDVLLDVEADLGVVVAFGRIIGIDVLARLPLVNLHFSLLPRWRGAAPVERALLVGDEVTGVCLMALEEGLDTGGVYRRTVEPIRADDTLDSLRSRLVTIGVDQLRDALDRGFGPAEPQVGEVTHAAKITADDLRIDWTADAATIDRQIRLGGAHTSFRGGRFKVWSAALEPATGLVPGELDGLRVGTGGADLLLGVVQPEGKPKMAAAAWRNGARPTPGERLGT